MRPRPFNYHRPESLADALALLETIGEEAAPYAGGTELLLLLKLRLADYSDLVGLKRIAGLDSITRDGDVLSIGAMATHARIAASEPVRGHCPALARLCGSIANVRVRAAGTLGGNLCFAEPRADPPVLLAALGAELVLESAAGKRTEPADGFVVGPLETRRKANELLTEIRIPLNGQTAVCARIEQGDHSLACAALAIGRHTRLRLGYGAGVALRFPEVEAYLARTAPDPDRNRLAELIDARIAAADVDGDADAGETYRRHLMGVAARRAVMDACEAMAGAGA